MTNEASPIKIIIDSRKAAAGTMESHRVFVRCRPLVESVDADAKLHTQPGRFTITASGPTFLSRIGAAFASFDDLFFGAALLLALSRSLAHCDDDWDCTDPQVLTTAILVTARAVGWPAGEPISALPPDYMGPTCFGTVRGLTEVCVPSHRRWAPDRLVEAVGMTLA